MIKKIRRRFITFNLLVISVVFVIVGSVIFINNENLTLHRLIISCIVFLGVAFLASILIAKIALEPIKKAWKRQLDFTADASHELRTPLAVMQTSLEIILDNEDETVKSQKEWLDNIALEHERMKRLVEDLLTLSRGDTDEQVLNIEVFDLNEVLEEVRKVFCPIGAKQAIEIEVKIGNEITQEVIEEMKEEAEDIRNVVRADTKIPVVLQGDQKRIKQLIIILVDNAIKYMGRAGKVILEVNKRYKLMNKRAYIVIQVRDTGNGIDKEKLKKIFERFYRGDTERSQEGSGLGLAIAKWIVESHRGTISVQSKLGEGTSFTIQIPASIK